jgi:hypothetical protein
VRYGSGPNRLFAAMQRDACNGGPSGPSAGRRVLTVLVLRTLCKTPCRHPSMCYVLTIGLDLPLSLQQRADEVIE